MRGLHRPVSRTISRNFAYLSRTGDISTINSYPNRDDCGFARSRSRCRHRCRQPTRKESTTMKLLHIDSSILGNQLRLARPDAAAITASVARRPCRYRGRLPGPGGRRTQPSVRSSRWVSASLPPASDTLSDAATARERWSRKPWSASSWRRRDRRRCAAVQLLDPEPAQVVDRPHRAGRSHLHLHRQGPQRPGRWQDGDRGLDPWRRVFDLRRRPRDGAPGSYLQTVFGFLGITDVRFVRAEGLAMGAGRRGLTPWRSQR
jgi:hypothetical protein